MLRFTLATFILLATATALHAQAPIERPTAQRLPSPALSGVSVWPQASSIRPGTRLLVTTLSEPDVPFSCRLHTLTADELVCAEGHGSTAQTFDRIVIGSIALPAKRPVRLSTVVMATGGACLLVAYLVATHAANSGGSANGALAETGLTILLGGAITRGYERARAPEPLYQTPVYIAPRVTFPASGN